MPCQVKRAARAALALILGALSSVPQAMDQQTRFALPSWPETAASPDFSLIDGDGHIRTLTDFRGSLVALVFGFTHCPDACPAELFKLSLSLKGLGESAKHVQVVFVTLDPQRDTQAVLQDYVRSFDASFIALSGSVAQINRAAANFHVEYSKVVLGDDYTIDHSNSIFVFGKNGRLRLVGSLQASAADFEHDLAELLNDPKRSVQMH